MNKKVLVIGLDGFEQSIAERLVEQGRMPNFQKLSARSARMELEHGVARRTGLAWEHFASGLSPEGAERWSAVTFSPQDYSCRQELSRQSPFVEKFDFKTVVFDAPYFDIRGTPDIDGFVNWGAHDPGVPTSSRPESLVREITDRFGEYPAREWIYGFVWPSVERTRQMGESLSGALRLRAEITRWLLSERFTDWSLGIVVVGELHSAIEALWHGMDDNHELHHLPSASPAREALESVYLALDELLGILHETFPDCLHVDFSMHGMGPNTADVPAMALLPEYLYQRHYRRPHLQQSTGLADAVRQMCANETQSWTHFVADQWIKDSLLARVRRKVRKLTNKGRKSPDSIPLGWMPAYWYEKYWSEMPAFALPAFYDGQIRVNVQGRERNGIVPVDEYDTLCETLCSELMSITDTESDAPVVKEFVLTHPGDPMAVSDTEADIIIVWNTGVLGFRTQSHGVIGPLPPRRPGGHTGGPGIGLWSGPGIRTGDYETRESFDMVPSLIEILTGEPTTDFSGQSMLDRIRS